MNVRRKLNIFLSSLCWIFIIFISQSIHGQVTTNQSVKHDQSPVFVPGAELKGQNPDLPNANLYLPVITHRNRKNRFSIEQTKMGTQPPPELVASFDGLGYGYEGPQGTTEMRNPSDNSLAVGPNHIIQTVNSRMGIFSKKGKKYNNTGIALYGPVETNNIFRGFGGPCEKNNNGDAVIRYDQLADRWLLVMPLFRRADPGLIGYSGPANPLFIPIKVTLEEETARRDSLRQHYRRSNSTEGKYCMCYAVSTSPDPMGSWYRYEFTRDLFPDYPRPAVWTDGYYTTTSTGDNVIQKHIAVADREKMLKGENATEQLVILDSVNFLNAADLDGVQLPPDGSPNLIIATGGEQLNGILEDDGIYVWKLHVDWKDPSKTHLDGPQIIEVAPYSYLCGGQLTECVPQPGVERRLDAQGDKIMARLVYRRLEDQESIIAVHSVATSTGGGGVRWYEFRINSQREVSLYQQGTYAPDNQYRWMASPAMDARGNIGIGYSFGGPANYPGQRFAGRLADDPPGFLTMKEVILVEGEESQTSTNRWEDYTQTAIDPSDDMTIWYVGDYLKKGSNNYSTRIGAFRLDVKR